MEAGTKETLVNILKKVSRVFNELGIHYVLVGGLACILYGVERTTLDIDFIVEKLDEEKAEKLALRLSKEGFYLPGREVLSALRGGGHATVILRGLLRLDIKFASTELDQASLRNFHEIHLDCTPLKVAGLEENIAAKIAVLGDLKDLEDALILMDAYRDAINWDKLRRYLSSDPLEKILKLLDKIESVLSDEEYVVRKVKYLRTYIMQLLKSLRS